MAGRGSVEQRGKDSWRLIVFCGYGPDGKQIKKTKSVKAPEKKVAEKLLAEFVTEVEKGMFVDPSKLTFKDFAERWLRDYGEKELAPKTFFRYRQILESRVYPAMGHLKIQKITPVHLMDFYRNLQEDNIREDGRPGTLAPSTVRYHHAVISSIMSDAVEWQVIGSNPADRVKAPKVPKRKAKCYDRDQAVAMLVALDQVDLRYRTIVNIALFTTLRRGEIMGLEWSRVDLDAAVIHVEQASQYLPGQGTFTKAPKNETSERPVAISAFLVDLLQKYKKAQAEHRLKVGDLWHESDRLFTTWDGRPMHSDTISSWFPEFLEKHKLPHLNFHGLRHTGTTILADMDVPLKQISGRLGHADIRTTANIYAHYLQSADKAIADKLEKFYQETKDTKKKEGRE